jgi:hypothetical protein
MPQDVSFDIVFALHGGSYKPTAFLLQNYHVSFLVDAVTVPYPILLGIAGLACNLQKHLKSTGSCLLVNNRTKNKAEVKTVLDAGARWVGSPAGEKYTP